MEAGLHERLALLLELADALDIKLRGKYAVRGLFSTCLSVQADGCGRREEREPLLVGRQGREAGPACGSTLASGIGEVLTQLERVPSPATSTSMGTSRPSRTTPSP